MNKDKPFYASINFLLPVYKKIFFNVFSIQVEWLSVSDTQSEGIIIFKAENKFLDFNKTITA